MRLDDFGAFRHEVLWWEICGYLHDLGKLSDYFLWYRQNWHRMPNGYHLDPHDHDWMEKDSLLSEFPALKEFFENEIPAKPRRIGGELSVRNAIHKHDRPADNLTRILKQGDGADSRYDRNYPLFGCEQTDHDHPERISTVYRSNVFGYEDPERTAVACGRVKNAHEMPIEWEAHGTLESARRELYAQLQPVLATYRGVKRPEDLRWHDYRKIRDLLRRYFEPALSDTTRPGNDTSLWEHAYSVATVAKVQHLRYGVTGEPVPEGHVPVEFTLWGFGWDALRFLSHSHRIGDILGRREVLDRILDRAEELIEFELPFGNRVYRDDGMIFFLTPALPDYEGLAEELRERVSGIAVSRSDGELLPQFTWTAEPVQSLTRIVEQIRGLRKKVRAPVAGGAAALAAAFQESWEHAAGRSVCGVCRMRPTEREQENKLVCRQCLDRRRNRTESFDSAIDQPPGKPGQTPMVQEIADPNGRVALIVARLGLEDWLGGEMVRTTFITERAGIAKTIAAIDKVVDVRGARANWPRRDVERRYAEIRADVGELQAGADLRSAFLYHRDFDSKAALKLWDGPKSQLQDHFQGVLKDARKEHPGLEIEDDPLLVNCLCAKTPTPSTVLDVWETAHEFFRAFAYGGRRLRQLRDPAEPALVDEKPLLEMEPRSRAWVEVEEQPEGVRERATFDDAKVGRLTRDVVYAGGKVFWLIGKSPDDRDLPRSGEFLSFRRDDGKQFTFTVARGGVREAAYLPYRCISASPVLLLLLLPADRALPLTRLMHRTFRKRFGKVWGRLPFAVGNIFFPQHSPMYAVLDAARRMERNFRKLQKCWLDQPSSAAPSDLDTALGGGAADFHHPYFITPQPLTGKPSYFHTLAGPVVHMQEAAGERILAKPNLYQWLFLDASAGRFGADLEWMPSAATLQEADVAAWRERSQGRVLLLGELEQRVDALWEILSSLTDTQVRNLEQALAPREQAWRAADPERGAQGLAAIADILAVQCNLPLKHHDAFRNAVRDGFLFPTLNLYLRVLKQRTRNGVSS